MKKKGIPILPLIIILLIIPVYAKTADTVIDNLNPQLNTEQNTVVKKQKNKKKSKSKKRIRFHYDNEDLIDVINFLAAEKGINIILPSGADAITAKLTLHVEELLSVDEAWDLLYTILNIAGYSLIPKHDMFIIIKNSKEIVRESLPIYIGISPDQLPDTDQRIQYLYYLSNIKVAEATENDLTKVLKSILPDTATYKVNSPTNALLLIDTSNNIKSIMKIVTTLDEATFQEKIEVITLRQTTASIVAKLFNENILKVAQDTHRYRLDSRKPSDISYFSKYIKIIADDRTNSLIILGRIQAVERVQEFIYKYIDVDLDSGKSILHTYRLQYLDAAEFAPTLQKIVESARPGGPEQARAAVGKQAGKERFFDEVYIVADKPKSTPEEARYGGGNKLIIAARHEDWKVIQRLIEELDKPQRQVIIEVLIADLTIDDLRSLGSMIRNHKDIPLPEELKFQAAHLQHVVPDSNDNPTTIQSDLLRKAFDAEGNFAASDEDATQSVAGLAPAGATVISLNQDDGKTWSLLQIAKQFNHTKILSHPHVIATDNKEASIKISEDRLVRDEAKASEGGVAIATFKSIEAKLEVKLTPKISSAQTVNLTVDIYIEEFKAGTRADRIVRKVVTNANVNSEDILALGGLLRDTTENTVSETPLLGKIPILGWLFKKRSGNRTQTNLTVFLKPIIIEPRFRGGVGSYTTNHIKLTKKYADEGMLFDTLQDPITRWFFKTDVGDVYETAQDFLAKDEFKAEEMGENGEAEQHRAHNKQQPLTKDIAVATSEFTSNTGKSEIEQTQDNNAQAIKPDQNDTAIALKEDERADKLKELLAQEDNPLLSS